jgi:uncharacterized protein YuzE
MAQMIRPSIDYEKETDVAYVLRGQPKATWNFPVGDFTVRLDLEHAEVIGIDITNFSKHFSKLVQQLEKGETTRVEEYFEGKLRELNKSLLEAFVKEKGLAPAYESYLQSEAPRFVSGQLQVA